MFRIPVKVRKYWGPGELFFDGIKGILMKRVPGPLHFFPKQRFEWFEQSRQLGGASLLIIDHSLKTLQSFLFFWCFHLSDDFNLLVICFHTFWHDGLPEEISPSSFELQLLLTPFIRAVSSNWSRFTS